MIFLYKQSVLCRTVNKCVKPTEKQASDFLLSFDISGKEKNWDSIDYTEAQTCCMAQCSETLCYLLWCILKLQLFVLAAVNKLSSWDWSCNKFTQAQSWFLCITGLFSCCQKTSEGFKLHIEHDLIYVCCCCVEKLTTRFRCSDEDSPWYVRT